MALLTRDESALVVVDAQIGFANQGSMNPEERAEAEATLLRISWFAGVARLTGVPALVVEEGPERSGRTDPRILEEVGADARVVRKGTFALTAEPEAVEAVGGLVRRALVVAGSETDTCVAQSAIGLAELGYQVVVLIDGTFSTGLREHQRGLDRMRDASIKLHDIKGVIYEWLPEVDEAIDFLRDARTELGDPPIRL